MQTQEMKTVEGKLVSRKLKVAIVAARENGIVTAKLADGAVDCLLRHGASGEDILLAWAPGIAELPLAAGKIAASGEYDAVICLGAVIGKGGFELREAVKGIARASRKSGVPVLSGIVAEKNAKRALGRAGGKRGNKGFQCAAAAIETADLMRRLDGAEAEEPEEAAAQAAPEAQESAAPSLTALLDEDAARKLEP